MVRETLGDRIVCGVVGAILGAAIALGVAWLLGVYSNTLGPGRAAIDIKQWIFIGAGTFGLLGLMLGSHVGTVLGKVIAGIYHFERDEFLPAWLVLAIVVATIGGVWWFIR